MVLQEILDTILRTSAGRDRFVVGIAGPPGAGKSTLARAIADALPGGTSKVLEMDGFHYDNSVLDQLGLRDRKGSPETFDCNGFEIALQRIHENDGPVAIPVFDRQADLARAGAAIIDNCVRTIIVEGNYLLLNEPPWSRLRGLFDLALFVDVERLELERRLLERWRELGYSEERARRWVETNDMPNVDRVIQRVNDNGDVLRIQQEG